MENYDENNIKPILAKIENYYLTDPNYNPKELYKNIENMSKTDLSRILRKDYKRYSVSKAKYKESWKNPGYMNEPFAPFDVLKPKVLGNWEQLRVNMPVRSYERYPVEFSWKLVRQHGEGFGFKDNFDQYSEQYSKYLIEHLKKFNHFIERPSHFQKKDLIIPQLKDRRQPFKVKRSDYDKFNQPNHNTFIYENKFRMKN